MMLYKGFAKYTTKIVVRRKKGFAKYTTKIAKFTTTILKRRQKLNTLQLLNAQRVLLHTSMTTLICKINSFNTSH